jgi:hypothetical protein
VHCLTPAKDDQVYLTILFLVPLWDLYSFRTNPNSALRRTAFRAFIGSCVTLTSSVANLLTIMILKGEPGYICLMCCNADSESEFGYSVSTDQMIVLFSVIVLHWMTCRDQDSPHPSLKPEGPQICPQLISRVSSRPSKSRGTFDFNGTTDAPGNDNALSMMDGTGLVSTVVSEETSSGHKRQPTDESMAMSDESKGGITLRTSLTMESTRDDGSLYDKPTS